MNGRPPVAWADAEGPFRLGGPPVVVPGSNWVLVLLVLVLLVLVLLVLVLLVGVAVPVVDVVTVVEPGADVVVTVVVPLVGGETAVVEPGALVVVTVVVPLVVGMTAVVEPGGRAPNPPPIVVPYWATAELPLDEGPLIAKADAGPRRLAATTIRISDRFGRLDEFFLICPLLLSPGRFTVPLREHILPEN